MKNWIKIKSTQATSKNKESEVCNYILNRCHGKENTNKHCHLTNDGYVPPSFMSA